jgi:hypothetical protein
LVKSEESDETLADKIAGCLQNIGQGFGLMIEEREAADTGARISEGIPLEYFILSVSPTISLIDNFSNNWVDFSPRENSFTPYSGLCELISLNWLVGVILPIGFYVLGVMLCRKFSGRSLWLDTSLYGFLLVMILGFLQMQQYPLRTATRFFYSAFVIYAICYSVGLLYETVLSVRPVTMAMRLFVNRPKRTERERLRESF